MSPYIDEHVHMQSRRFNRWIRGLHILVFPVIFIVFIILAPGWLVSRLVELPMGLGPVARLGLGGPLIALGGALYLWTIVLFARAWGTQVPIAPTQKLVTTGPYAVSRNPMVTSGFIMICGVAALLGSWSFLLGGLLPSVYVLYIKLVEEKELEARFGEQYLVYKESTPFIIPRWVGWRDQTH